MKSQLLIEEHGGVLQWVAASKRVAVVVVVVETHWAVASPSDLHLERQDASRCSGITWT